MPKLRQVCEHVRSKNAGPFWITLDLFFHDRASFDSTVKAEALTASSIATLFGVEAAQVKRFAITDLLVLKISYPRLAPQGGTLERDMHGGQQYVRLLDIEV